MTNLRGCFFLLTLLLTVLSCNDNPTGERGTFFGLTITVRDTSGHPVPGLRVSAWNKLDGLNYPPLPKGSRTTSTSSVMFALPRASRVHLSVVNLDGSAVATLSDGDLREAGVHMYQWTIDTTLPTRVYKCLFLARADTIGNPLVFRDSIYVVLMLAPDITTSVLGWTSGAAGSFETDDPLFFPNVFPLPWLRHTMEDPTVIDSFRISDSVRITLTDTLRHISQRYWAVVRAHTLNSIELTWNPLAAADPPEGDPATRSRTVPASGGVLHVADPLPSPVPTEYRLWQNFPNPFN